MKFDWLLARARALGAKLATGHYARVERRGGRLALRAAADPAKDQSYFLYGLGQEALRDVLFPVGELAKPEVRAAAARAGLANAAKPDSQEICFVTRGDAADFVALRAPGRVRPGEVVSTAGEVARAPRRRPPLHGRAAARAGARRPRAPVRGPDRGGRARGWWSAPPARRRARPSSVARGELGRRRAAAGPRELR